MTRLRHEGGFVVPSAVIALFFIIVLSAAALFLSLRSLDSTNRDRRTSRAVAAAEAGVDAAAYRMNRTLSSGNAGGLLGFASNTISTVGCLDLDLGSGPSTVGVSTGSGEWCLQDVEEQLGDGSRYRYVTSTGVVAAGDLSDLIQRKVVSIGTVGGVSRRVMAVFEIDVDTQTPGRLWRRKRFVECTSGGGAFPAPADQGC